MGQGKPVVRAGRRAVLAGLTLGAAGAFASGANAGSRRVAAAPATPVATPSANASADAVIALVEEAMTQYHLKAAIAQVMVDGEELVTFARGESMNGVPATPEMHFRNGAVAISYIATLLLVLVDQGVVGLDDPIAPWLPDLPDGERATFRMLANMTAGYPDYVNSDQFVADFYANPFRVWTPEELIAIGQEQGRVFAPGENWAYSHSDYVILGLALEAVTGKPLQVLMRDLVLDPLGLVNTENFATPWIPEPVLHAFTSERRTPLRIPPGTPFYEESTYWDPSWTIARGAIQTTTIADMVASVIAIGEGTLLSPASHRAQTEKALAGFGHPMPGCATCMTMTETASYGLGIWLAGNWLLQNPSFGGYGAFMAYLPARKIGLGVVATVAEDGFDAHGDFLTSNAAQPIGTAIAALLAPESPIRR
ncbi:MAG: serine hydrolase domain-containing protein [Thermomicrobiales bacterium]